MGCAPVSVGLRRVQLSHSTKQIAVCEDALAYEQRESCWVWAVGCMLSCMHVNEAGRVHVSTLGCTVGCMQRAPITRSGWM